MDSIRKARITQELSQAEVAEKMGINVCEYSRIENDYVIFEEEILDKINKALGVEILFIEKVQYGPYISYLYYNCSVRKYFYKFTDVTSYDFTKGGLKIAKKSSKYYDYLSLMQLHIEEVSYALIDSL